MQENLTKVRIRGVSTFLEDEGFVILILPILSILSAKGLIPVMGLTLAKVTGAMGHDALVIY